MPPSRLYTAYVLTLIVGIAGACGGSSEEVGETEEGQLVLGQTEEHASVERGIAPGGRALVLSGYNGDIRLEASAGRFATLRFTKIARGADSEAARRLLKELSISEEGNDSEYFYRIQSPNQERTAVDVRGRIPKETDLRIEWQSGAISLADTDGPLRITSGSGPVEIERFSGSAEIRVKNGGITFGVEQLPNDAEVILETSNGNITVSLPPDASTQIAAETSAGSIRTTGLEFQDRQLEPMQAGSAFQGRLGRGNARIRVRTDNGTIHLTTPAVVDTTAAIPVDSAVVDTVK